MGENYSSLIGRIKRLFPVRMLNGKNWLTVNPATGWIRPPNMVGKWILVSEYPDFIDEKGLATFLRKGKLKVVAQDGWTIVFDKPIGKSVVGICAADHLFLLQGDIIPSGRARVMRKKRNNFQRKMR